MTREDVLKEFKVVDRADKLGIMQGDRMTLSIDLDNADKAFSMNWDLLLEADDFEFTHDIIGIQNNINRETGEFENCFVPRCVNIPLF